MKKRMKLIKASVIATGIIAPFLTGSSIMKAASKLDDVSDIGGYMNKFDNVYDSMVINYTNCGGS